MLKIDHELRSSASKLLKHPWLTIDTDEQEIEGELTRENKLDCL